MSMTSLFLIFAKTAILTFGGGYAMIPLFEHEIVTRHAFMTAADFANLVALAQVTPGPVGFNSATYVGMMQNGITGATVASLGVIIPSVAVSLTAAVFLKRAAKARWLKLLMQTVRPCVVGIIGAAVIFFARTAVCWQGAAIFAMVVFMRMKWKKLNPIWSLLASALAGWLLLGVVKN